MKTRPAAVAATNVTVPVAVIVPVTSSVAMDAAMGCCAPSIDRIAALSVTDDNSVTVDRGAARATGVGEGTRGGIVTVPRRGSAGGQNGNTCGECKQSDKLFHAVSGVGVRGGCATCAAISSDEKTARLFTPRLGELLECVDYLHAVSSAEAVDKSVIARTF